MVIYAGDELQGRRVDQSWLLFFFVGLLAQLIDGALGMAFGVTATTVMPNFNTIDHERFYLQTVTGTCAILSTTFLAAGVRCQ